MATTATIQKITAMRIKTKKTKKPKMAKMAPTLAHQRSQGLACESLPFSSKKNFCGSQ